MNATAARFNASTSATPAAANVSGRFSPVTLNHDWSTLSRLILMILCASFGTIINGFFVAAFFVNDNLQRLGNVFLSCVGLADLIITSAVMPVSAVVLLSGQWDTVAVCQALQFLTESSTYCYSAIFTLVAVETYFRLCRTSDEYETFLSMRIGLISLLVFFIGFSVAGIGVYLKLDYDYCMRSHSGNFYYRMATFLIFHGIPFVLITYCLLFSSVCMRRRARMHLHYRRSLQYVQDTSLNNVNITAYVLYVCGWVPYLIVTHEYPSPSDEKYYHSVWIGVCRSVFTSLFYSILNRDFRNAFAHLFYYCCCKSNVTGSLSRHRREYHRRGAGDVRVHIMHRAVTSNSPQRGASAIRETQEL